MNSRSIVEGKNGMIKISWIHEIHFIRKEADRLEVQEKVAYTT